MTPVPSVIAVCGAGTMGAGIAQLAAAAGARVLVQDPQPGAVERGIEGIRDALAKRVADAVDPALDGAGLRVVHEDARPGGGGQLGDPGAHRAGSAHRDHRGNGRHGGPDAI